MGLEDRNEVMVIVLVLGIKFWQNTIEKQSINDVNHCKVIINYLQGFVSDINNKSVDEKLEIQQDPLDSIIKSEDTFLVDDDRFVDHESEASNDHDTDSNDYDNDEGADDEPVTPKTLER